MILFIKEEPYLAGFDIIGLQRIIMVKIMYMPPSFLLHVHGGLAIVTL